MAEEVVAPEVVADPKVPVVATETPVEQKPEKTFSQKELDEIVEKRLAKERRKREEVKQENAALRRLALERGEPAPKKEAPAEDKEPVRGDYASYEEFIQAQASHRARGTAREEIKRDREEQAKKSQEESARKSAEEWRTKVKANSAGIADFEDVMSSIDPNSAVARLPSDPIGECDNPAKVLYHLATHPEDAERIAVLPQGQQARAIWKLDAELGTAKQPAPVKPSAAPAPITPIGGGKAAPAGEMPDPNNDQAGWLRWRNAQVRAARGKPA